MRWSLLRSTNNPTVNLCSKNFVLHYEPVVSMLKSPIPMYGTTTDEVLKSNNNSYHSYESAFEGTSARDDSGNAILIMLISDNGNATHNGTYCTRRIEPE